MNECNEADIFNADEAALFISCYWRDLQFLKMKHDQEGSGKRKD